MSRIQSILDKAERDGAVRRVHTIIDQTAGSARAFEAPLPMTPLTPQHEDSPHPAPAIPARSVRSTGLDRNLVAVLSPGAAAAEQYRALRTRVAQADHGRPLDVILVTSPGRREGKSLTAANLALTMAQNFQSRICIVDADLRYSRLHTMFGVKESVGLADVLVGETMLADALVGLDDQQITVLPAGATPSHPAELLGSTTMRRTIEALRTQFDRVIIDAPAVGPLADVGILAPLVDGVVLVVQAGVTTKPAIHEAVTTIGAGKLLGVVLNDTIVAGS
jgi:capsular exopolysaccharide synthesis family protein